jgi:hypothetical protein
MVGNGNEIEATESEKKEEKKVLFANILLIYRQPSQHHLSLSRTV